MCCRFGCIAAVFLACSRQRRKKKQRGKPRNRPTVKPSIAPGTDCNFPRAVQRREAGQLAARRHLSKEARLLRFSACCGWISGTPVTSPLLRAGVSRQPQQRRRERRRGSTRRCRHHGAAAPSMPCVNGPARRNPWRFVVGHGARRGLCRLVARAPHGGELLPRSLSLWSAGTVVWRGEFRRLSGGCCWVQR